ncbi:MAG: PAS domain S-box protein [Candidatus Kapabacteria bacterium]|nr:PAS domain S-box protein [Candidatus Kapabacteria bacterium]
MYSDSPKITDNYLMDSIPFGIMFIDRELRISRINNRLRAVFGSIEDKYLYDTDSKISKPEVISRVEEVFQSGKESSCILTGVGDNHKSTYITVNMYPYYENSIVKNVIILISDNKDSEHSHKEFNLLFETVPAFVSIVDKNLRIVRANQRYRDTFGNNYSIFYSDNAKHKNEINNSPTSFSFIDGHEHTDTYLTTTINSERIQLMVSSIPFTSIDGIPILVMEISHDITELSKLQDQLYHAHDFYSILIENSAEGIVAIDSKGRVQIFNQALKDLLNWKNQRKPGISKIHEMLPAEFFTFDNGSDRILSNLDSFVVSEDGEHIPVRINAFVIKNKKNIIGRVAFFQDLRKLKNLEEENFGNNIRLNTNRVVSQYQKLAEIYNVSLNVEFNLKHDFYKIDEDNFRTILSHLIFNGIDSAKNSAPGGKVSIQMFDKENKFCITVSDNGDYISEFLDNGTNKNKKEIGIGIMVVSLLPENKGAAFEITSDKVGSKVYRVVF